MKPFELFFHNNGDATLQVADFSHTYSDMKQLAQDFTVYQGDGHTDNWEGNESDHWVDYDSETERNGGYLCITEKSWNELDPDWGYNVSQFIAALPPSALPPSDLPTKGPTVKNLYEIKNAKGVHLCYQVGTSEADAVESAKVYYAHKSAAFADFIRVND